MTAKKKASKKKGKRLTAAQLRAKEAAGAKVDRKVPVRSIEGMDELLKGVKEMQAQSKRLEGMLGETLAGLMNGQQVGNDQVAELTKAIKELTAATKARSNREFQFHAKKDKDGAYNITAKQTVH